MFFASAAMGILILEILVLILLEKKRERACSCHLQGGTNLEMCVQTASSD
jgi:hypothetical protein